jgi:hypothetical protein
MLPTESNDNPNGRGGDIVQIPSSCISNMNNDNTQTLVTVRIQRRGGISLDMCNFQFIGEVGDDCFVKVGAGVTRNTLNEALRCVTVTVYESILLSSSYFFCSRKDPQHGSCVSFNPFLGTQGSYSSVDFIVISCSFKA